MSVASVKIAAPLGGMPVRGGKSLKTNHPDRNNDVDRPDRAFEIDRNLNAGVYETRDDDDDASGFDRYHSFSVQLKDMSDAFANAAEGNAREITRAYAVMSENTRVARVLLRVDQSFEKYLTARKIEVERRHPPREIQLEIIRSLKAACVRTSRKARVEAMLDDDIGALLQLSFFERASERDYVWSPPPSIPERPITWDNWTTDVSWAPLVPNGETAAFTERVMQMVDFSQDVRGARAFARNARWFKPETNLNVISKRLNVSVQSLRKYRVAKRCYGSSSAFARQRENCRVLNGWAATVGTPFIVEHACLCAILDDGEAFVFDLVRDRPLFLYGVALRRDFEEAITSAETYCRAGEAEFIIDALNFLQLEARDEEELHEVLAKKSTKRG